MVYAEVTWIFVCAIFLAILVGWGLGANDVANSFGPSVGARALTLKQAVLVAAIFEFAGAVLMGSGVVTTIRSGITNINYFLDQPDILAYGMLCAMLATGLWMLIATYWELPVSSTQCIVASIAGMTIVAEGFDAVLWSAEKDSFPYLKGMSAIVLSWLFSPLLAGGFSFILFFLIRALVLRQKNAYQRSIVLLPLFTFITFFVVTYFTIAKGGLHYNWNKTPDSKKAWISAIVASGTCLISIFVGIPLLRKKVQRDMEQEDANVAGGEAELGAAEKDGKSGDSESEEEAPNHTPNRLQTFRQSRMWKAVTSGVNADIHKEVETNEVVRNIHENVEVFDTKAETSFKYLQVCSACANAFAHGANEVANSIGPLAAIYQVWQDTSVSASASVPTWLLAVGGFAIVLGLATYGHHIIRVMGVKMTRLTNSRGFTVEICTAAVVILASRFDLPMSTTPATVGAITGVGLLEGRRGFNFRLLLKCVIGWVATIIIGVLFSAAFMAQGIYAPSKAFADQRSIVSSYLNTTSNQIAELLSATGNETLVEQAQSITALTATQQVPVVDLIPPMNTQAMALTFANDSNICTW